MQTAEVRIVNKLGLHARAAAKLVSLAATFDSSVEVAKGDRRVNGKSIMGVMMLAAGQGACLTLYIDGEDELEARHQLVDLVENYFGEGE